MKAVKGLSLLLLMFILSACGRQISRYDELIERYSGSYEVVSMDWVPEDGRPVFVDINNDGVSTNDIVSEIKPMVNGNFWRKSAFYYDRDNEAFILRVALPVLEYSDLQENSRGLLINFPEFYLPITINDDGSLASERFEGFTWADDDRKELSTFGGVYVLSSFPGHIDLSVDRYVVFNDKTSQLVTGTLKVWLTHTSSE